MLHNQFAYQLASEHHHVLIDEARRHRLYQVAQSAASTNPKRATGLLQRLMVFGMKFGCHSHAFGRVSDATTLS